MHVLAHNQRVCGDDSDYCFDDYRFLADHTLSYVDPIGNSYLMPCHNPRHKVHGNNVYENEFQHHILNRRPSVEDPDESEVIDDEHDYCDLLLESRKVGH